MDFTIKTRAQSSALDLQRSAALGNPAQWIFRLKMACATQRNGWGASATVGEPPQRLGSLRNDWGASATTGEPSQRLRSLRSGCAGHPTACAVRATDSPAAQAILSFRSSGPLKRVTREPGSRGRAEMKS